MREITTIKLHQIEEVKQIIFAVCSEILQVPEELIRNHDSLSDIDDMPSHYLDNKGTFLVLVDDDKVVGSGGIRRLNDEICELKRMWLLKDYRGQGFGKKMAQMLLDFAKKAGYKKVRLDCGDEQKQAQAVKLYKQLGFYVIERYNDSLCTVFMEKIL
ncbi:GNAT family N-acetyltransferase [Tolypothrix sp. VBCCA 56010]|uniref:GNAT family N-acetyltransferase n=1 Tax=Tolypothrix sp. VBCCA 56010 TaxID=3137731 RepID=UPI003D7DD3D7